MQTNYIFFSYIGCSKKKRFFGLQKCSIKKKESQRASWGYEFFLGHQIHYSNLNEIIYLVGSSRVTMKKTSEQNIKIILNSEAVTFITASQISIFKMKTETMFLNCRTNDNFFFNYFCLYATREISRCPSDHAKQAFIFTLGRWEY